MSDPRPRADVNYVTAALIIITVLAGAYIAWSDYDITVDIEEA